MADSLSKDVVVLFGATDLSAFISDSSLDEGADVLDKTTYGNAAKRRRGGLKDHAFKVSGIYDTAATNTPQTMFDGAVGTTFSVDERPQGTAVGKPKRTFSAVLAKYSETRPVADIIRWSAEFSVDGDITKATQ